MPPVLQPRAHRSDRHVPGLEHAGLDRADRWGIFIGQWAPTLMAMGVALRIEETHMTDDEMRKMDSDMEMGSRTSGSSRVHAPAR